VIDPPKVPISPLLNLHLFFCIFLAPVLLLLNIYLGIFINIITL
jgi:hypothetical protein